MTDTIPAGTVVQIGPGTTASSHAYGRIVEKPAQRTDDTEPGYAWVLAGNDTHLVATSFLTPMAMLPTSYDGLFAVLAAGSQIDRNDVLDRLIAQLGNEKAWKLFDPIDTELRQGQQIAEARTRYTVALDAALDAVRLAARLHDELAGELYDVEIAEDRTARLARTYLDDASRALDTVRAINPDGIFTKKV